MDKSWIFKDRLSEEYKDGIESFLDYAFGNIKAELIKCPCNRCCLSKHKSRDDMKGDLQCYGFMLSYTNWILHGESMIDSENISDPVGEIHSNPTEKDHSIVDLMNDLFPNNFEHENAGDVPPVNMEEPVNSNTKEPFSTNDGSTFDEMLGEYGEELYPGCESFTKLTFILKLYHIKCLCRISDKGISMVVDLIREAFSMAKLPDTFRDMKMVIRKLGLSYESIHVCPNHCMLYWEGNASKDKCEVCQSSRWKEKTKKNKEVPEAGEVTEIHVVREPVEEDVNDLSQSSKSKSNEKKKGKKKIPAKVLRYFPLKPRLQRLFMSSKTASDMRWHATDDQSDGKLRHPKDGVAWKAFDERYPEFASDPRNVRLGLASDGFNPFGTMSLSYSIWPVILFPYNLPPWLSMTQTSMILSMIIPGKQGPGNDIDVFLQPLVKELKDLWSNGVQTRDASTKETFNMRAAVMWTVSDFPAFGNLSGWNTYTTQACPTCNFDGTEQRLRFGGKNCFMGHRRFLPPDHHFRQRKEDFDGSVESRTPPTVISGSTIKNQQENVHVIFGKHVDSIGKKRSRSEMENTNAQQWKKSSIFFELPYWEFLNLRHNLDVMHIEKNVFDNIIYTLIDDKGKSKDNLKARKDLRDMGIRSDQWPDVDEKYAPGRFTLDTNGKIKLLGVFKNVKFPDNYASNISRCFDLKTRKISGLKSHDSHVIMRDLLSIAIRNLLPEDVVYAIIELCRFFRDISSKVLDVTELDKLQERIVLTLCHLEMIFPPSFFTVMVHLTVHLVEEAKQGGPVVFRWMYPIERKLGYYKSYVRNRAKPEGSICEQYLADECVTFCSMYLQDIETRFNRIGRVDDRPPLVENQTQNSELRRRFPHTGKFVGAGDVKTLSYVERQQAHRFILINCSILDNLRERYRLELSKRQHRQRKRNIVLDIEREIHLNFGKWFKEKVEKNDVDGITDDMRCLALGPSDKVVKYLAYNVNGCKFRASKRDDDLKTQNSGVYVSADTQSYASSRDHNPMSGELAYYGKLEEVIELNYYESFRVVLFKCKWADTINNRGYKKDAFGHSMVNFSRLLYSGDDEEDEPFVLASQAQMVYYVEDPCEQGWHVAVNINPRDFYDMGD